jgi:hypothetical protein
MIHQPDVSFQSTLHEAVLRDGPGKADGDVVNVGDRVPDLAADPVLDAGVALGLAPDLGQELAVKVRPDGEAVEEDRAVARVVDQVVEEFLGERLRRKERERARHVRIGRERREGEKYIYIYIYNSSAPIGRRDHKNDVFGESKIGLRLDGPL